MPISDLTSVFLKVGKLIWNLVLIFEILDIKFNIRTFLSIGKNDNRQKKRHIIFKYIHLCVNVFINIQMHMILGSI